MVALIRIMVLLACLLPLAITQAQAAEVTTKTLPAYGNGLFSRMSPDGRYLATHDNSTLLNDEIYADLLPVRVYDVTSGQEVAVLSGEPDYAVDVAFSPDSSQLAALYPTGWVHIWNIADSETVRRLPVAPNGFRLSWLADGETLAISAGLLPQIQLWNVESGAMTALLTERFATFQEMRQASSDGPPDGLSAFAAAPDGNLFALATHYGRIHLWTPEGESTFFYDSALDRPMLPIRDLVFTPDGETLIALNNMDAITLILDVETGRTREIETDADRLHGLAVSLDGTHAAWLTVTEGAVVLMIAEVASGDVNTYPVGSEDELGRVTPFMRLHFTADNRQLALTGQFISGSDPADYVITLITLPE